MQILAIDLGTDMVPALGLGVESPEEGVMDKPPRRLLGRLLNRQLLLKAFVWYRLIEAALAMGAFLLNYWVNQGCDGSSTIEVPNNARYVSREQYWERIVHKFFRSFPHILWDKVKQGSQN